MPQRSFRAKVAPAPKMSRARDSLGRGLGGRRPGTWTGCKQADTLARTPPRLLKLAGALRGFRSGGVGEGWGTWISCTWWPLIHCKLTHLNTHRSAAVAFRLHKQARDLAPVVDLFCIKSVFFWSPFLPTRGGASVRTLLKRSKYKEEEPVALLAQLPASVRVWHKRLSAAYSSRRVY